MRKTTFFILIVLFFSHPVLAKENDWQFWNTDSFEFQIKEQYYGRLEQEFRIGNDISKLIQEHTDIGLIYKQKEWLHWAVHYRYIWREKNDDWEEEHRPHINFTLLRRWKGIHISDRNRFEHRILSKTKDIERYRNKFRIALPIKIMDSEVTPYIADEYVIDFDKRAHNFNRLSGGLEFKIIEDLTGDIYYLWQNQDSRGSEAATHVIGLNLNFYY